jgi:hypothetical protein
VNVFEELTNIAKIKTQKKDESFGAFARRLTDRVAKACDADEETWTGLSDAAQAWFNEASKALNEKTAVPELPGMPKEGAVAPEEAVAPPPAKAEPVKAKKPAKAKRAEMDVKPKDNGGRRGRLPSEEGGLEALREKWNELVKAVEAEGLRIARAKWHKVTFESYTMSYKRIAWLEQEIAARRAARSKPQEAPQATA